MSWLLGMTSYSNPISCDWWAGVPTLITAGFLSFTPPPPLPPSPSLSLFSRQLYQWLETCEQEGVEMEQNSAAGIRMGMGTFNLVCTHS